MPRIQERPRPARPADAAIFIWSDLIQQHIMQCGVCLRNRHADPTAGHMPFTFEALRVSAWSAGWRLDRFARWACPACQMTPAYHTAAPVTLWAEGAGWARRNGDPDAAKWLAAAAEHDLFRDVLDHAGNGRHRAVPR